MRAWHHKEHTPILVRVDARIISGQFVHAKGFLQAAKSICNTNIFSDNEMKQTSTIDSKEYTFYNIFCINLIK